MASISRRKMLKSTIAGTALASSSSISWAQEKPAAPAEGPIQRKGNIRQSVCRWCYPKMSVDELCAYGAQIGLKGVDLLQRRILKHPRSMD